MSEQTISVGRIVTYKLTADDAKEINRRRTTSDSIRERMGQIVTPESDHALGEAICGWPRGAQAHIGNEAKEGQEFPMMVVADWGGGCINGQVFLDGTDVFWTLSRLEGENNGNWHWPVKK